MSPEPKPSAPMRSRRWRTVPLRELGLQARAQAWYRRPLGLERLAETADGSPLWLVLEGASLIWSRTPRRASLRPAQQQRPPSPVAPLVRTATQRSPPIRRYSPSIWGRARMLRLVHPTIPRALLAPHGLRLSWQIVRDRRSVHSMRCRPLMARGVSDGQARADRPGQATPGRAGADRSDGGGHADDAGAPRPEPQAPLADGGPPPDAGRGVAREPADGGKQPAPSDAPGAGLAGAPSTVGPGDVRADAAGDERPPEGRNAEPAPRRARGRAVAARVDHLAEGSAWLRCVAWWLEVAPEGGIRAFTPSTAAGALLARTIEAVGADAVAARFDWLAHEQSGFAAAKRRWVAEHDVQLSAFARQGRDAWLQEVDAAALAWVAAGRPLQIARNSPSRASGGRTPPQGSNPGERALLGVLGALGRGRRETVDAGDVLALEVRDR